MVRRRWATFSDGEIQLDANDHRLSRGDLLDPDLFEPLLQTLGALSSVASLAAAWLQIRGDKLRHRQVMQKFQLKEHINNIQRHFDDIFRDLDDIVDLFYSAETRNNQIVNSTIPKFGSVNFNFTQQEFDHFRQLSGRLSSNYMMLKNHCFNMIITLNISIPGGEDLIEDALSDLNEQLNSILFESKNYRDSLQKIRSARDRVNEFIRAVRDANNSAN